MPARVIAVTGGKGGVGKSTTTVNLGVSLRMDGHSVALIDADVEMPNLVELLGIEPTVTIHDVLSGTAETEQALIEIGEGFAAIPGDPSISGYASIEPAHLETVVGTLEEAYDFVLLDTGAGLSYDDIMPLGLADEIVLVSSPDAAAVENAKRTQAFVERLNRPIGGVVITKADGSVDGSIAEEFDTELLAVVPDDQAVRLSTAAGKPLEVYSPNSPAAQAYRQLEANLTDGVLPPQQADQSATQQSETVVEAAGRDQDAEDEASDEDDQEPEEVEPNEAPRPGLLARFVRRVTP
ncbi:MAG TPA: P-loop NTPase [Halobacteriales archaeon]|nr:P-loop NTPase [Halobacteriales archaeon]